MSDIKKLKYYKPQVPKRKMAKWKKILIIIASVIGAIILLVAAFFGWLTITEFNPAEVEQVTATNNVQAEQLGTELSIVTWNIGYSGLGKYEDFVLDGGKTDGSPDTLETFREYLDGIIATLSEANADITICQEVDVNSKRSYYYNEADSLMISTGAASAVRAINYKCNFVPFPWPPIGKVEGGLLTLSKAAVVNNTAERIALPCPYTWPVRIGNLKRCLLVSRYDIQGTDKQLVVVNLHLEAYDSGEGRAAQTAELLEVIQKEYAAGNYVIAGGDFNQAFPGTMEKYPVINPDDWNPSVFSGSELPEGWQLAFDAETPTCRLLNMAYDPTNPNTQYFVIDGFIVSPNVEITSISTIDAGFNYSDHNPVKMQVTLK